MTITIGYDASTSLGARTGVGRATLGLLEALLAREDSAGRHSWRVFMSSFRHGPGSEHAFLQGSPRATIVRRRTPGPWLVNAWRNGSGPLAEELLGPGLTLYHAPASYIPPRGRIPRSVTVHDLAFLQDPPERREKLGGAYFAETFPKALPDADLVFTPSAFVRGEVIETYGLDPERVVAIPWGLDERLFHRESERMVEVTRHNAGVVGTDYILGVSASAPRKRPGLMLDAYARLCEREPATPPLVVLGWNGEPHAELKARPHLHRRVQILGRVKDTQLAALYTGASATLFTSAHEGFGFPVLEAQACGSPVVCSPDTAVREVAGDAAGLVAGDDPEAWAAALETMVFDEPARETARTAGLANAARYRWEKTAEAYLAAWESHLAWPGVL